MRLSLITVVLVLLLLAFPAFAQAAVVSFDAAFTGSVTAGPSVSTAVTIGSASNRAVAVCLQFEAAIPSGLTVTVGGETLTEITGTNSGTRGNVIFGKATSLTGAQTVVASWTGTATASLGFMAYSGVDPNAPFNGGTTAAGSSASASVTVTSSVNDMTMTCVGAIGTAGTLTSNQTGRFGPVTGSAVIMSGDTGPATGTTTHTWTLGSGTTWVIGGVNIKQVPVPDLNPPTDPTNLSCSGTTSSQIACSWTASTDDIQVANYRVELSSGSTCAGFTEIAQPTANSYTVTGLAAVTTRCVRVRAWDGQNFSVNYSNTSSGTTLALRTSVLTWTDLSSDESNFAIDRCEGLNCSGFAQIATVGANISTFTDTQSPNPGACYRVKAQKVGANDSAYTNNACTATATVPVAPSGLTVSQP